MNKDINARSTINMIGNNNFLMVFISNPDLRRILYVVKPDLYPGSGRPKIFQLEFFVHLELVYYFLYKRLCRNLSNIYLRL